LYAFLAHFLEINQNSEQPNRWS